MTNTVTRLSAIIVALILAAATLGLYASVASAQFPMPMQQGGDRTDIEVENEDTSVTNNVTVRANTGGNEANGGDSGDSGRSHHEKGYRPGGQSSEAGPGGDGGSINTGAATAYGTVYNDVNSNRIVVEGCGCDQEPINPFLRFFRFGDDGKILKIEAENEDTSVSTNLDVKANTGRNEANGGDSRGGGSSHFNPWMMWFGHHMSDNSGGDGGTIRTGAAYADGLITNVVNRNVVRVLNGDDQEDDE